MPGNACSVAAVDAVNFLSLRCACSLSSFHSCFHSHSYSRMTTTTWCYVLQLSGAAGAEGAGGGAEELFPVGGLTVNGINSVVSPGCQFCAQIAALQEQREELEDELNCSPWEGSDCERDQTVC